MAARVVCGSQPDAAVRSASVAPSGRETASSSTASLPPGRAKGDPGRRHRQRRGPGRGRGTLGAVLDTDGVETGGGDHQALALARVVFLDGPLRLPGPALDRGLGDQAAADQRAQRALEGGALQRERLGRGQDAQIGAGGGGREQNRLGVGELRHDFGPLVGGGAGLRGLPLTEGPVSGRSRAGPGRGGAGPPTLTLFGKREVQRRLRVRQRFWIVYRRFESSLLSQPHSRSETAKRGSGICAQVPWLAKGTWSQRRRSRANRGQNLAAVSLLDSGGSSSPNVRDGLRVPADVRASPSTTCGRC